MSAGRVGRWVAALLVAFGPPVALLAACTWPERPYLVDMACLLIRPAMVAVAAAALLLLPFRRLRTGSRWLAACAAGLLLVLLLTEPPAAEDDAPPPQERPTLRLAVFNAHNARGGDHDAVAAWLLDRRPDVVCVLELPLRLHGQAERWRRYWAAGRIERYGGIRVFSRHVPRRLNLWGKPGRRDFKLYTPVAFEIDPTPAATSVRIAAAHLSSPRGAANWRLSLRMAEGLGRYLRAEWALGDRPTVLLADLNSTPQGRAYQTFADHSGMRDAGAGRLNRGTWPADLPALLTLPIDHIFLSPHFQVLDYEVGPASGSDHRPVLVEVALTEAPAGD